MSLIRAMTKYLNYKLNLIATMTFFYRGQNFCMRKRILHNQNKLTLEKKETMNCHCVTKNSSVLCYELVIPRKCHSHIKTG